MTLDELRARYPDLIQKIDGDSDVFPRGPSGPSIKEEFANAIGILDPATAADAEVQTCYDTFCIRFGLMGTVVSFTAEERLGHVMSMNGFSDYIADPWLARSRLGIPSFGSIGYPPARPLSDPVLRNVLMSLKDNDLIHSLDGPIWCFRGNPPSQAPFAEEPIELFPCRLGLKRSKETPIENRWIAFPVKLGIVEWRRPTFADTSWRFLPDWVPGGWTVQPSGHSCGSGFPEIVGRGAKFGQLDPAIGPFVAQWPRLASVTPP